MSYQIRPARAEDLDLVAQWTSDTFAWGDYIEDRFLQWLDDDQGLVLVATDNDLPWALVRTTMLSDDEAWIHAARVHPDHRRRGLATELNDAGRRWAVERGGRVVRLAIEQWNQPARRQVEGMGYRPVSSWLSASFGSEPGPSTMSVTPDHGAAWIDWNRTELMAAGRGLFTFAWDWRRLRPDDLGGLAARRSLYEAGWGWAAAEVQDDVLVCGWMSTGPEGCSELLASLASAAARHSASVLVKVPDLTWVRSALVERSATWQEVIVYTMPL